MLSDRFAPWPHYEPDEMAAVQEVLQSGRVNYWTGEQGKNFETEFANHCQVKHAVAVANGTVALELALLAKGIGPGDDVIVTPRTFLASASCAVARGAKPVFADIDPISENITASSIEQALTPNTRAVIAVHHAGWPCEMDEIMQLAAKRNFIVIEDCAQAHGAMYRGRPVGSLGHLAAYSFCQDKIMSTGGEGGMLVTNDSEAWKRAWAYKDHGKDYDAVYNTDHAPGFRWLHKSFGSNWRLTEMQSAIGRIQLGKLASWTKRRSQIAAQLGKTLAAFPSIRVSTVPDYIHHAYYRLYVHVNSTHMKDGWTRDRIMQEVSHLGVPIFSGSCPEIYKEEAFTQGNSAPTAPMAVAEAVGQTSLALLTHPTLTRQNVDTMCSALETVLGQATLRANA